MARLLPLITKNKPKTDWANITNIEINIPKIFIVLTTTD